MCFCFPSPTFKLKINAKTLRIAAVLFRDDAAGRRVRNFPPTFLKILLVHSLIGALFISSNSVSLIVSLKILLGGGDIGILIHSFCFILGMAYLQYGKSILRRGSDIVLHHPILYAAHGVRYRKLDVILTTTIDKLGKAGETVKVKPGFFRNHLMPKLLAVPNINKFAYLIREQRKIYQPKDVVEVKVAKPKTEEDQMKEYQTAAKRLDSAKLVLRKITTKDGNEVREPVTKDEIVSEIARQVLVRIEPENLHLPTPLASIGEFEVPLRLPRSIPLPEGSSQWTLKLKIRRR